MPYGAMASKTAFWVEVPKAGSTTISNLLGAPLEKNRGLPESFPEGVRAFVFVREPLSRTMSGYSEMLRRLGRTVPWGNGNKVEQFERFVDYFVDVGNEKGYNLTRLCVWGHVVRQTFFMQLFPGEIDFVGRVENIDADLAEAGQRYGFHVPEAVPQKNHALKGHRSDDERSRLLRCAPGATAKLIKFLEPDYACLGYPMPELPAVPAHGSSRPEGC